MNKKRILLFLFGCIFIRSLLVLLAIKIPKKYLPVMGYAALIPAFGFSYIYLFGLRKTGPEVFGEKIWWNHLRPIHALLYFLFAYNAIKQRHDSYKYLLVDVIIGLLATTFNTFNTFEKSITKMF